MSIIGFDPRPPENENPRNLQNTDFSYVLEPSFGEVMREKLYKHFIGQPLHGLAIAGIGLMFIAGCYINQMGNKLEDYLNEHPPNEELIHEIMAPEREIGNIYVHPLDNIIKE